MRKRKKFKAKSREGIKQTTDKTTTTKPHGAKAVCIRRRK